VMHELVSCGRISRTRLFLLRWIGRHSSLHDLVVSDAAQF
jgi:hypothetical protein